MTSIKVSYQSTVRRFTVSNNITWLDFESKLREIFSLPPTFKFSLSYTDEEGDIITLSTDLELQEILSQSQSNLKFTLTPEQQQPLAVDTFSSNDSENGFVSVEKEISTSDNVSGETDKQDKNVTVMDAADEPSFKPTIPKGKQKEESPSTYETNEQEQEEKQEENNNEQRAPFIDLAEQFQRLLDQFKDVLSNNPQLVEQANAIMDQILQNIPVDINQWAQWLNTFRPEGERDTSTTNAQEGETNNPRGSGFGQFSPFFPPSHSLLSNPWIQRMAQDFSANYPGGLGNLENFARSSGFNGPWNFNGGCPFQQQQQQQQQEGLSQEELKEKIDLLHSMGFWEDDVKNEELLKKYNGDIEKVVETLIGQQTERNNNNSYDAYSNNSTEGVVGGQ